MSGKWLALLKDVAPRVERVSLLFNPQTAGGISDYLRVFEAAAPSFAVKPIAAPVHNAAEIESAIAALGREPGGGLVVALDVRPLPASFAGGAGARLDHSVSRSSVHRSHLLLPGGSCVIMTWSASVDRAR